MSTVSKPPIKCSRYDLFLHRLAHHMNRLAIQVCNTTSVAVSKRRNVKFTRTEHTPLLAWNMADPSFWTTKWMKQLKLNGVEWISGLSVELQTSGLTETIAKRGIPRHRQLDNQKVANESSRHMNDQNVSSS